MKEGLRRDKAKTHVLPISQLGLMEMTRQRHTKACAFRLRRLPELQGPRQGQERSHHERRDPAQAQRDFKNVHVTNRTSNLHRGIQILDRLRTEDEKLLIEMEKRYFGKLSFRGDTALHAEPFKIINVANNEELASVNAQPH